MFSTVLITFLAFQTVLSKDCYNLPNTATEEFTYHICTETALRDFNQTRDFCQQYRTDTGSNAHLVVFQNEEEFNFLISQLNATNDETFRFYPGIYQKVNSQSRYNPETGEFHWVTDPVNQITEQSDTYWQPFANWITGFDALDKDRKQTENFLMDREGRAYPVVSIGGILGDDQPDPAVICRSKGVLKLKPNVGPNHETTESPIDIEPWIYVVIAAGAIFILILAGICIGCCISKRRVKNFQKVPTQEKNSPNQQQQQQTPGVSPENHV